MDSKQKAFLRYALDSDWEMLLEYRKSCDDFADHITKLIALMERFGCEDGILIDFGLHGTAKGGVANNLRDQCQAVIDKGPALVTFTDSATCYPLTRDHLLKCSGFLALLQPALAVFDSQDFRRRVDLGTAITWRQIRSALWDVSDRFYRFSYYPSELISQNPSSRWVDTENPHRVWKTPEELPDDVEEATLVKGPGAHVDLATPKLLEWASGEGITIAYLARMLVEVDLDRERSGSPAVRTRREKKRLDRYQKNKRKPDHFGTEYQADRFLPEYPY